VEARKMFVEYVFEGKHIVILTNLYGFVSNNGIDA